MVQSSHVVKRYAAQLLTSNSRPVKARKLIIGFAWIAFFSVPVLLLYNWDPLDASITQLSHYKTSRDAIPSALTEHFPIELPNENVWYYFTPGPLQANPAMQLLVKPDPSEIDRIYDEMAATALERYIAYDPEFANDSSVEMRPGEPMWVFDTNGLNRPQLNGNDEFFVTYVGNGSEPSRSGVCINRSLGTVVYYCDLGKHNTYDSRAAAAKQTDETEHSKQSALNP